MKSTEDIKQEFQQGLGEQVASNLTDEQYYLLRVQDIDNLEKLDLLDKADLYRAGLSIGAVAILMQGLPLVP